MILSDLFLGFLKVGCFAFGGAYGAIPLIREVVLSYGWAEEDLLTDLIALSESTPGPIMVNLATFVGSRQAGLPGAVLATTAVVLPSFLVILLVTAAMKNALKDRRVQAALGGLKPCLIGIILATGCWMILHNCFTAAVPGPSGAAGGAPLPAMPDAKRVLLTAALVLLYYGGSAVLKKKRSPILLILISAGIGAILF